MPYGASKERTVFSRSTADENDCAFCRSNLHIGKINQLIVVVNRTVSIIL